MEARARCGFKSYWRVHIPPSPQLYSSLSNGCNEYLFLQLDGRSFKPKSVILGNRYIETGNKIRPSIPTIMLLKETPPLSLRKFIDVNLEGVTLLVLNTNFSSSIEAVIFLKNCIPAIVLHDFWTQESVAGHQFADRRWRGRTIRPPPLHASKDQIRCQYRRRLRQTHFPDIKNEREPTTSQGWYEILSLSILREPSPPERWPATSRGLCLLRGIPDATTASRMQFNARRRQQAALRALHGSGLPIRYGFALYDIPSSSGFQSNFVLTRIQLDAMELWVFVTKFCLSVSGLPVPHMRQSSSARRTYLQTLNAVQQTKACWSYPVFGGYGPIQEIWLVHLAAKTTAAPFPDPRVFMLATATRPAQHFAPAVLLDPCPRWCLGHHAKRKKTRKNGSSSTRIQQSKQAPGRNRQIGLGSPGSCTRTACFSAEPRTIAEVQSVNSALRIILAPKVSLLYNVTDRKDAGGSLAGTCCARTDILRPYSPVSPPTICRCSKAHVIKVMRCFQTRRELVILLEH
ncbi:uncharacterized protein CLUP02_13601 [Colletotrichum lupini]|uniref:Uncharacterized protein n=1 Tax=Colletotrichum lupini TaxID=145971 RepID=A0A9Q8T2G9_9PEZI|nr:uncharacterized protein CLUP02_13601 [Colletotrichum lupini]UQC88079.1 hypothetical protein CLUP02_13601 [Colletotrichum lupini]